MDPTDHTSTEYFSLDYLPNHVLSETLSNNLFIELGLDQGEQRRLQKRHLVKRILAFNYILGTLIVSTNLNAQNAVYHSLMNDRFTDENVSSRNFKTITNRLIDRNYLAYEKGNALHFIDHKNNLVIEPRASHYYPTEKLINLCSDASITPDNVAELYKRMKPTQFIKVREPSIREGKERIKGQLVSRSKYERSLSYKIQQKMMESINNYLWDQKISGTGFNGLVRISNNFTDDTYQFDQGGRLYTHGQGFQYVPKTKRQYIRINDEATVEIDIKSSHLTIMHGLKGLLLGEGDPYYLPGIPRDVVKQWMTISLSQAAPLKQWPCKTKQKLLVKFHDMEKWTAPRVSAAALEKYSFLNEMNSDDHGWANLQFKESEIIIKTMLELMNEHDVPALPVHDSLIVPKFSCEITKDILKKNFIEMLAIDVQLEMSGLEND